MSWKSGNSNLKFQNVFHVDIQNVCLVVSGYIVGFCTLWLLVMDG